mgnify:FL=1
MFKIIVGVFFAAITSLAAADDHGADMASCVESHSKLQVGSWEGEGWVAPLGAQLNKFGFSSEITEKDGMISSNLTNSAGNKFSNSWAVGSLSRDSEIGWVKEKTVTSTVESCFEQQGVIWIRELWSGTVPDSGAKLENLVETTVSEDLLWQTLASKPSGSDMPFSVWWVNSATRK